MSLSDRRQRLLQERLSAQGATTSATSDRPRKEPHVETAPLSSAQRRMWYQAQIAEESSAYNFCVLLRPEPVDSSSKLSRATLITAVEKVVDKHDILRTVYRTSATGVPVQDVDPELAACVVDIELSDAIRSETSSNLDERLDEIARRARDEPFNLESGPLLRMSIIHDNDTIVGVLLVMPHIAGDGGSFGTVLADFERAYNTAEPSQANTPALQYLDYALWEQRRLGDPNDPESLQARQLQFWEETLEGLPIELALPNDRPRPSNPTFDGSRLKRWLGPGLTRAVRATARTYSVTPLVLLQSAVTAALAQTGAGTDIPLGTPVDLRQDSKLAEVVGFFSNTVVVRADISGDPTFAELIGHVQDASLAALDHREVPFESVVEHLNPPRTAGRNPLFGVMVTSSRSWPGLNLGNTRIRVVEPEQTQAKFDLTFVIHEDVNIGNFGLSLLYSRDLFDESTAQDLFELVVSILGQGVQHPQQRFSQMVGFDQQYLTQDTLDAVNAISQRTQTLRVTSRTIEVSADVDETAIVVALARLLERHIALRLLPKPTSDGRWLADSASIWETPILLDAPVLPGEVHRLVARIRKSASTKSRSKSIIELHAPAQWIDEESWSVLIAEFRELLTNPNGTSPRTGSNYIDWLNQTSQLAASEYISDKAERWMDILELAEDQRPEMALPADAKTSSTIECTVPAPDLDPWATLVAARTAVLATMIWLRSAVDAPFLVQVDEPDRDRDGFGESRTIVGRCRRDFPVLLDTIKWQEDTDGPLTATTIDTLLQAVDGSLEVDGELIDGTHAASFALARDMRPDLAGVFDEVPLPDVALNIGFSDPSDEWKSISTESGDSQHLERWTVGFVPGTQQITLTISNSSDGHLDEERVEVLESVLAQLISSAVDHQSVTREPKSRLARAQDSLVDVSDWDRRGLQKRFGKLQDILPLSPLQEGLRFHGLGASEDDQDVYISQTSIELEGVVDPERLHRSVDRAVELVPTVTAGFAEVGAQMVQAVPASVVVPWRVERARDHDRAMQIADEEFAAPFDAKRPPLLRFALIHSRTDSASDSYRLLLTTHHILLDGWSMRLLLRLIMRIYADEATQAPPSFRGYLEWLSQQSPEDSERVWGELLQGIEPTLLYPTSGTLAATAEDSGECVGRVGRETTVALMELARSASTTLSNVLELAWGALLIRLTGSTDVVFGSVVSGRPVEVEEVQDIIGLMFNTVPVRVKAHHGTTAREALQVLHDQKSISFDHAHVNLGRLQQIAGHSPLFDTLFAVQNLPRVDLDAHSPIRIGEATVRDATHYPLSMAVTPDDGVVKLRLMFHRSIVDDGEASELMSAYQCVLEEFVRDSDVLLSEVDALSEQSPLLPDRITGESLNVGEESVADLIVRQAEATPEATALVSSGTRLTYAELVAQAHQLAHLLRRHGVRAEHRVALLLPRTESMVTSMFGVFAAHAAYVPIDPATPRERIRSMIEQSLPTVILTVQSLAASLPDSEEFSSRVIMLDDVTTKESLSSEKTTSPCPDRPLGLQHLAYVIFTSGSTGQPKGVEVPYVGLTNMLANHQGAIFDKVIEAQGRRRLRIAHTTSFAFDASWEQLLWLLSGHEVHVIDDELRRDPERLLELFDRERIDGFDVTPTYGEYLVENGLLDRPRPEGQGGTGVVFVTLGGEAVSESLWERLRQAPGIDSYNLYGPTEYTINALGADLADTPYPTVGRPIANTQAHILGPGLLPAPIGTVGELYLGGVGMARGYLGQASMTAERFVPNPFGLAGSRLYRTGDLARWRSDGNIDFLGRADSQLKIRGYRIEPAEIENALASQSGIRRAAVIGRTSSEGRLRLVAYVVSDHDALETEVIRDNLRQFIPAYMLPEAIVAVDDLPMTINGKLDVNALPNPEMRNVDQVTPPRTSMERLVCEAFASVLEREDIDVFADFFESGGHSLLTVQLVALLRDSLETSVSVRQIYEYSTPAALATALGSSVADTAEPTASYVEPSAGEERNLSQMLVDARLPDDLASDQLPTESTHPELSTLKSVFLTGAAGFLGSFVLAELLRSTHATINCLVRASDKQRGHQRVRDALTAYGLWEERFAPRICAVPGDLSVTRFGLGTAEFVALAEETELIIHNGGATNEAEPYQRLAATNVGGAVEVLRLAARGNRMIPVHFVSTASVVARRGVNPPVISEDTRLAADEVERTGYVQSKWVAEELMHEAADRGMPVIVHRPGRISGHSVSGVCTHGIGFWHFIRSMLQMGTAPALRSDGVTLAPVDYVAQAIVSLIERGKPSETYHLSNRMQTSIGAILRSAIKSGYTIETIPFREWKDQLARLAEHDSNMGDRSLAGVLLLAGHVEKYDGPATESALGQDRVANALAGSGIAPPPITEEVLNRYVDYFVRSGFFLSPSDCGGE